MMGITVSPIMNKFAAEVEGIDLAQPIDDETASELRKCVADYSVIIMHDQSISYQNLIDYSSLFGNSGPCQDITNLDGNGHILDPESLEARQARGNFLWHVDMPVLEVPPRAAILLSRELPPSGGATQFADLGAAWDALSDETQQELQGYTAVHDIETIRRKSGLTKRSEIVSDYPATEHPLICNDIVTGKDHLYLGAHTSHIKNLGPIDGQFLLDELGRHATQPDFVYTHEWSMNDLVMWNARCVLHRVRAYESRGHRRRLWRVEILCGDRPIGIDNSSPNLKEAGRQNLD